MATFNTLNSLETLDDVFAKSHENPVVLFKHSTTCPISSAVHYEISNLDAEINLVIIQSSRNISNEIAERTNIRHESPQAIVLKDGKPVYHASHYDVTAEDLAKHL